MNEQETPWEVAKREIEAETAFAQDVAAEHGQMFDNVKHMTWFRSVLADALSEEVASERAS